MRLAIVELFPRASSKHLGWIAPWFSRFYSVLLCVYVCVCVLCAKIEDDACIFLFLEVEYELGGET